MQGEGGNAVEDSDSYIDQKHLEYWDECIDTAYRPVDMKVMKKLVAPKIKCIIDAD